MPAIMRISVVFPAPLAPSSPHTPGVRVKFTPSTAVLSLYCFVISQISNFISSPLLQPHQAAFAFPPLIESAFLIHFATEYTDTGTINAPAPCQIQAVS